ncbi:hypothetical protein GCM10023200_01940 [Actinomycetospora chlora]|uniref:histidine kinase n=1 Tax=Actinomycetospora chlora TaxID=663608 RepID=A0ABP9A396_9PSEU
MTAVVERSRGGGSARRLALALGAAAVLLALGSSLDHGLKSHDLTVVLALAAAGSGAAAALLAVFAARLNADHRAGWVAMALACYGLLAIPASTIAALDPNPAALGVRVLADGLVTGLLLTAAIAPPRLSPWRVGAALLVVAVAVLAAAALGSAFPAALDAVATSVPVTVGLAAAWSAAGIAIAVRAAHGDDSGLWLVGIGIALLGGARALRATTFGWPVLDDAAVSGGFRLAAIAFVLGGALRIAWQALARFETRHDTLEEELRLAETRLARTAERDHELRNGLAGLAGATTLVDGRCPDPQRLGTVVASELSRLDDLLQTPIDVAAAAPTTPYAVAPVLHGLVTLRGSTGMDVRLAVEPGLHALGSPATLAQVVTNLLANAARHAAGSPVEILAVRHEDRVVVRVRDFGPGPTPGAEEAVLARGVRDRAAGGLGLGLYVCRRLLADENGTLALGSAGRGEHGCVVTVDLPAAPPPACAAALAGPELRSAS